MDKEEFVDYNKELFKKVAPKYKWLDLIAARCRTIFCRFLGPVKSLKVLDVATGTGMQALALRDKGASVTGVDLSEDMLHYAKLNDPENTINFRHANGTDLPFKSHEFDLTVMSFALHCMTEEVRAMTLKEMKRVTKENGRVAFIDYSKPERGLGLLIYKCMTIFETPLYKKFLETNFDKTLKEANLKKVKHEKFFFGAMQMISCEY